MTVYGAAFEYREDGLSFEENLVHDGFIQLDSDYGFLRSKDIDNKDYTECVIYHLSDGSLMRYYPYYGYVRERKGFGKSLFVFLGTVIIEDNEICLRTDSLKFYKKERHDGDYYVITDQSTFEKRLRPRYHVTIYIPHKEKIITVYWNKKVKRPLSWSCFEYPCI